MIQENLLSFKKEIPENVTLVAVSKTKPVSAILEAYAAGQRVFGENKVQEMVEKYEALPKDIQWHMIGHLQRNKVKYMAGFVDLIHGVDSMKTLKEIDKQAKLNNRIINCLLQVKIAQEDTKFGFEIEEILNLFTSSEFLNLTNVCVVGFMGMATFTEDEHLIEKEFANLYQLYNQLKPQYASLTIVSMGMSNDYQLAIKNGSNMIRIGSAIFGERNYK